jgi:hypothetical protein
MGLVVAGIEALVCEVDKDNADIYLASKKWGAIEIFCLHGPLWTPGKAAFLGVQGAHVGATALMVGFER